MGLLSKMIEKAIHDGFSYEDAEAKVCQDIILQALAKSSFSKNVTIKGGVVMRSISGDARRATQDIDLDFIRFPLKNEAISDFIKKLNCLEDLTIEQISDPTDLKQQDYHGKRVYIRIIDSSKDSIDSKIDIGIRKNISIEQEEYCFDICKDDSGASLLINSKEQIFTEKLRSLLKFANYSTRYKDVFDMCYLIDYVDQEKLISCLSTLIFTDDAIKENNITDIRARLQRAFTDDIYLSHLTQSKQNWLGIEGKDAVSKIDQYLESIEYSNNE